MASLYIRWMQKFIKEYAAFNLWANQRICSVADKLSEAQFTMEIPSSFSSIQKTLLHIWDSQVIWIKRMEGTSLGTFPSDKFSGTKQDILEGLISSSVTLDELANATDEEAMNEPIQYATLKGDRMSSMRYRIYSHVINHGSYHRGQLVTMFRQVGVTEPPSTDLIFFYRAMR